MVLNGRAFDDMNGEITCVANNGRSVVDYILASTSLFDSFSHFEVGSEDFSDHFPLHCTLKLPNINLQDTDPFEANKWSRFKWTEHYKNEFTQLFSRLFNNFKDRVSTENESTLSYLSEFIEILQKAGKCMKTKSNKAIHRKKAAPNGGIMNAKRQNLTNSLYFIIFVAQMISEIYKSIKQPNPGLRIYAGQNV